MANNEDYLTGYREFFEDFAKTVNPNDQLPVRLASYKLINLEVVGGIIDWTTQYLNQKKCPPHLTAPLIKTIIEEIRSCCKKEPLSFGFNPADNAYEPLKLMQAVMAKTNEVCLRYLDNSMLCSLPAPGSPFFVTSVCAIKNSRRRMEDRHTLIHDLNTIFNIQETSPSSYYAIFDGHAGLDAAAYSSAHLHQFLAENKHFASNPEQALVDAFCKTDALFIDKCKVESLSSGTTAVVALLRPKEKTLYIAWAGDSQALLVNQGRLLQCVDPHKPTRKDERDRIEKAGGCVIMWGTWRVNGQLAVSRAIGDPDYKPHVTAVPDVREISLDGNEDFLILACDGLWDFVSEDTAAKLVYYMVSDNPDETDRISDELAKLSRQQGSNDNISVIVVFLREPSKIAADYHRRAGSHGTPSKMEAAGLDNANCPFSNANGTSGNENILGQKPEGLLLNFTDNFTLNGTNLSSTTFEKGQTNGKKSTSDFSDEDFGPETDVDAVDEAILKSPSDVKRVLEDSFGNNNPAGDPFTNPFIEHKEKAAFEIEEGIHKLQDSECEEENLRREETPTPPVDAVQDVAGLDNAAESDSEDEWNYFKGEEANKENIPQPNKEVGEPLEEEDNMSQLNPNAAEFVPVSPTRSIPSPIHRALLNDEVIAQSPKRPVAVDINVPNESDFEKEVKSRPSDFDSYSNGHGESGHDSSAEVIDNLLNGKSVDEIPEFQPGSTPTKTSPSEEFHFGPNAAPFTPAKLLDQSEAALSTKAVYGDESAATIGTSFNESELVTTTDLDVLNKESDPMSASFYAEEGESNPFDLDKVHVLPDNLDEFLKDTGDKAIDNIVTNLPEEESLLMDDTISDLPEHNPLESIANNDEAVLIQTTDLDKPSSYEEKELASPLEPEKELEDIEASKQPQDELLSDYIVCDPHPHEIAESPLPEYTSDFAKSPDHGLPDSTSPVCDLPESKSPVCNLPESPVSDLPDTKSPVCDLPESKSPVCDLPESKSPLCDLPESKSPVFDLPESKSPVCDLPESKSPVCELSLSKSPILNLQEQDSPLVEHKSFEVDQHLNEIPQFADNLNAVEKLESEISVPIDELSRNLQSEIEKIPEETSLVCDIMESNSLIQDTAAEVSSTVCDIPATESLVCDIPQPKLDLPLHQSHELEVHQTEEKQVSLQEDITSSVKDVSSPIQDLSPDVSKDVLGGFVPQDITFETNHPQDIPLEMNQFEQGNILPDILSSSASEIANDVHGFVENIQASEMHFEQQIVTEEVLVKPTPDILDLHEEPSKPEHIDIKTENITPQYAEQAILTPSEEPSRKEDLIEEPVKIEEPLKLAEEPVKIEEPAVEEESKKEDISAPAVALVEPLVQETKEDLVPAVLTQPIVPEEKEAKDVKKEVKKAAAAAPPKKPIGKVQPTTKPLLKSPAAPKAAPAKAAPGTKPVPPKTTTARPPITATRVAPSTKPAPKPAPRTTTTTASRTITDKKPLQNGDIKTTTKSTTTVKKTESKLFATKLSSTTTTKSSATLTKTSGSPTKTAPTRPATVPSRTVGAVPPARTGATAAKTSTRPASSTAALPKTTTRPSTLTSSKSATGTVSARTSASKLTSTTPKAASPKTATAPPKPKPALSSPPKPRVPLTRTKAPDTEKQNKESANKLTASKNVTNKTSTTTTGSITSRVNSVRKTEPKTLTSSRTKSTTTTTTTTKSTTGKKPEEITRMVTKTKTTKIEKPKENGVSTVVTEEITVVNNVNNVSDVLNNVNNVSDVMNNVNDVINNVDQLLKDNSPIDNKLITEVVNTAD